MAKNYVADRIFTVKEIVGEEQYSQAYVEKIFQNLRAADIVIAKHGNTGGYSLGRHPRDISLKDVIEALEGATFDVFCEPSVKNEMVCTHSSSCGIRPVWLKMPSSRRLARSAT